MGDRSESRDEQWQNFVRHVQDAPGHLDPAARNAMFEAARSGDWSHAPADWAPFVEKVATHAYRTTDRDIDRLKNGGHDEDGIFEAIIVTAVGAAARRLDAAHRAMGRRT